MSCEPYDDHMTPCESIISIQQRIIDVEPELWSDADHFVNVMAYGWCSATPL